MKKMGGTKRTDTKLDVDAQQKKMKLENVDEYVYLGIITNKCE